MAYVGGYEYGYSDSDTGWLFTPAVTGGTTPIEDMEQSVSRRDLLWRHYTTPTQIHILYTSGTSSTRFRPATSLMKAADVGSGKGDRMVWPSPGGPYPITTDEAVAIMADETYADSVSGGA